MNMEELKRYSSDIGYVLDIEGISTYGIDDKLGNIAYAIGEEDYKKVIRMKPKAINRRFIPDWEPMQSNELCKTEKL